MTKQAKEFVIVNTASLGGALTHFGEKISRLSELQQDHFRSPTTGASMNTSNTSNPVTPNNTTPSSGNTCNRQVNSMND